MPLLGDVYLADWANDRVRKITVSTGIIATIAGTGDASYSGDGGQATSATLYQPLGLAIDSSGNFYVADYGNSRVRKLSPAPTFSPTLRPTSRPTFSPTFLPTFRPTSSPAPTFSPTFRPTSSPAPTCSPTFSPTFRPTSSPAPTRSPTFSPTFSPTAFCGPGTVIDAANVSNCFTCSPGSYSPGNTYECFTCAAGSFASIEGSSACTLCPISSYQPAANSTSCLICPGGRISPLGTSNIGDCISPDVNFALGFLAMVVCIMIAYVYVIKGRFLRISFFRFHDYLSQKVVELSSINERLVKAVEMQGIRYKDRKAANSSSNPSWNYFLFLVFSLLVVALLTLIAFIVALLHIGFGAMILWRDYKLQINLSYVEIIRRQLAHAFGFIRVICIPFVEFFALLSSIDIDLTVVGVTCEGSQAPMLLIINFMILGFVVIMILGDYNVVLNCVYAVLHSRSYQWISFRMRDILFHETGLKRLNFCNYIHWYTVASAIAALLAAYPIIAIIQVLMGYVYVSPLFYYDSAVDTPSCNRIVGIPNIDAFLGWTTKILVILMVPPVVYCVADILVPRYFIGKSFNVINNTATAGSSKNVGRTSTAESLDILCWDELDKVENIKSSNDEEITKNMFKNPINVTNIDKNNSYFYLLCPALFDCFVWIMSYLQFDLWFFSLLHAWFTSGNAINKSQEIGQDEEDFNEKCAKKTIDRAVIFPAITGTLDLQQKWVYFMRKKLPTYFKFSKKLCDPMLKFVTESVDCCGAGFREFIIDNKLGLFQCIDYACMQRSECLEFFVLSLWNLCVFAIDVFRYVYYYLICVPIIVVIGCSAYLFSFIVCYSGYGHLLTEDGRLLWSLVLQKYIVFLKVSLLGIWTEAEYKAFGILNHEYSIIMNLKLHSAIETAIKSKSNCVTTAPPTYAPISYDPSVLVYSLISVRAVLYLLIPKLSFICVYCKNTAAYPLFTHLVSREIKGLSVKSSIKSIFENYSTNNHNLVDRHISIDFLPLFASNIESDINPSESWTSYVLYGMNYINVYVKGSRMIQWSYGVYLTGVSMGILFSPDSSGWSYSLIAIVFPMAVINSLQAVIFFGHYFNVVGVRTNNDNKIVEMEMNNPLAGTYKVSAGNDESTIS